MALSQLLPRRRDKHKKVHLSVHINFPASHIGSDGTMKLCMRRCWFGSSIKGGVVRANCCGAILALIFSDQTDRAVRLSVALQQAIEDLHININILVITLPVEG